MIKRILDLDGRYDNDCDPWWVPLFWPVVYAGLLLVWRWA